MFTRFRTTLKSLPAALSVAALASVGIVMPASANTMTVARINSRWTSVVDPAGNTWSARTGFIGPINRSDGLRDRAIAGTRHDILYQSNLWGMTGFSHPVPDGDYRVRLLMAEDYHGLPGKRVFDVKAEGAPALDKVDIIAAVGARSTAYDRTFTARVADGSLDLSFAAVADKPLVSAIEIVRVSASGTGGDNTSSTGGKGASTPRTELLTTTNDVSGGGVTPVLSNGVFTMAAGAGDGRSEIFWGTATTGRIKMARGTTVTTQFQVKHAFSDPATGAKPSPSTWHTIFQLHGPTLANIWPAPPVSIAWQNGTYRIGGGSSVPTSTGGTVNQGSWYMPYAQAPENVWRTFKVTTYLDGPGRGWVSVWIDGQPYMTRWKPKAGTMYTDSGADSHKEISVKSGLYTGTASPTWNRSEQQRGLAITATGPQGTQIAVLG